MAVGHVDTTLSRREWSISQKRNAKRIRPDRQESIPVDPITRDFSPATQPVVESAVNAPETAEMPPVPNAE
jgi:hypothetical protein